MTQEQEIVQIVWDALCARWDGKMPSSPPDDLSPVIDALKAFKGLTFMGSHDLPRDAGENWDQDWPSRIDTNIAQILQNQIHLGAQLRRMQYKECTASGFPYKWQSLLRIFQEPVEKEIERLLESKQKWELKGIFETLSGLVGAPMEEVLEFFEVKKEELE